MIFLLVAGIGFLLAGLVSILFGIPVKEFSFGNTLILSGVAGGCTGAILLGLHVVVREIRAMGASDADAVERPAAKPRAVFPPPASPAQADAKDGLLFPGDRSEPEAPTAEPSASGAAAPMPWQDEAAARDRLRPRTREPVVPPPAEEEPTPKKRNLLFSSSRKERERAAKSGDKSGDPAEGDRVATEPAAAMPPLPPRSFEEAWPESERPRGDLGARRNRPPLGGDEREPPAAPERSALLERSPAPRSEEMTEVTVLKSGVVDGMAYSLYSDGSIEAQMPEGMMRFASIDELRTHLDQRS